MQTQLKNSITALLHQFIVVIVGLIIPQLMIRAFGSETYGLGTSISQFLSYATLIEGGIGGVTRAALYKSFASKEVEQTSRILKATDQFFKKMAGLFLVYIAILAIIYPNFINSSFDWLFTASLIVIIAISTLAQYCFGATYSILLQADQKNYVSNMIHIGTYLLNAGLTVLLVNIGTSFHFVKLVSSSVFVIRPLILNIYVRNHYRINYKVRADYSVLTQRWNGMAHHVAWFLHTNADVIIITIFGTLGAVSVYSIYYMVASSMTKIITSLVSGVEAMFGKMMALGSADKVRAKFRYYSMFMNTAVIILFTTAAAMLMPFVSLYTAGITDVDYHIPILGYALLLAEGLYCLRVPYHGIVTASGMFKETQSSAILEATINIVLSLILINAWGLPGVAVATMIAMLYRTLYYVVFLSRNILKITVVSDLCRLVTVVIVAIGIVAIKQCIVKDIPQTYGEWVLQAISVGIVSCVAAFLYDLFFYKRELHNVGAVIRRKLMRR